MALAHIVRETGVGEDSLARSIDVVVAHDLSGDAGERDRRAEAEAAIEALGAIGELTGDGDVGGMAGERLQSQARLRGRASDGNEGGGHEAGDQIAVHANSFFAVMSNPHGRAAGRERVDSPDALGVASRH